MEDKNGDGNAWAGMAGRTCAGTLGGFAGTFLCHPLEIIKVRLQVRRDLNMTRWPSWSMAKELSKLDMPYIHLYRGITANAAASAMSWGLLFLLKPIGENAIRSWKPNPTSSEEVERSYFDIFMATAISSFAIQCISNPLWVVKTRMLAHPRGATDAYPNTWAAFRQVKRVEGFRGFYSGFWISSLGIIQGAMQLAIFDHEKDRILKRRRQAQETCNDFGPEQMSFSEHCYASTISKVVSTVLVFPYQTIRSRMQMLKAEKLYGKGISGVSAQLWKEGRFRAFYKGLGPAAFRNLPATVFTLWIYETLNPKLTNMFGGEAAGARHEP